MSAPVVVNIDDKRIETSAGQTILQVCRANGIPLPRLCEFEGLSTVGACRLCVVEVEGVHRLLPACTTPVAPDQNIRTQSERLKKHRRILIELFFSERNHICAVCVSNNHCQLQELGYELGMDRVRYPYRFDRYEVDASHERFTLDHNRCILCTRCVRVCGEIESAHTWDVMNRGSLSKLTADLNQPWGESATCTSCGKCVQVCPTGALVPKFAPQGSFQKNGQAVSELAGKRNGAS